MSVSPVVQDYRRIRHFEGGDDKVGGRGVRVC